MTGKRGENKQEANPAPDEPLYRVEGLTKTYGSGASAVFALRGVTQNISAGELIVLLGPSGSGKSTILNILGGLDSATSGHVWFQQKDLTTLSASALTEYRRKNVGFVFQFYNLVASLTARENVALITDIAEDPLLPEDALAMVGLGARFDHFPAQMSGGEQQRVAIARAIAKRPRVLLCDEPTGALDSQTGIMVLDVIQRINRDMGTTALVITHNAIIAEMADIVWHFADGRLVEQARNTAKKPASELRW